jgi:hypothetical protein
LRNHCPLSLRVQPFLDLLADIDVILNVVQRSGVGKLLQQVANFFLG